MLFSCLRNPRSLLGVLFLLCTFSHLFSQSLHSCGSDAHWNRTLNPAQREAMDREIAKILRQNPVNKTTGLREIPVVVHIVHQGGPENISNAQVLTAIQHLNASFSNSGAYNEANGFDTEIGFCLAARDPSGNFTTGINRISSPLTNVTLETQDVQLKALSFWNSTQYLNIWVVAEINSISIGPGVAGYATLPASHGSSTDGIVVEAAFFGTTPDNSKVAIHEAGHYLGLYHTFEGGCANNDCQLQGDRVCDTPPDGSAGAAICSPAPNTCNTDIDDISSNNPFRPIGMGGLGDQPDPLDNYMDYGFQFCQIRFTQGQSTRMNASLSGPRASLLGSTGCLPNCPTPIIAFFTASANPISSGTTVFFTNSTTGATSYSWKVNGVPFSTLANPSRVFNTPGTYEIRLVAANASPGCTDSISIFLQVNCPLRAQFAVSDDEVLPGETVTFTQQSPGSLTYQWLFDGVLAGTGNTYSHTFPDLGGHTVCLITYNGFCRDTACYFVSVGDCGRKRSNVWALGFNVNALDLGTPTPTPTYCSMGGAGEGVSSICDRDGNLLMYSNGVSVWRYDGSSYYNGTIMPNGDSLLGGSTRSSTQGCMFVPMPDSDSLYYLFIAAEVDAINTNEPMGYYYNKIDLSLPGNGGTLGAVTERNKLLYNHNSEKLTAVRHANGCDVWILGHAFDVDSMAFLAYRLRPSGLDTVPIISRVGFPHYKGDRVSPNYAYDNARGYMKFSPDGSKVALVLEDTMVVEVFHFDKTNGTVSSPIFTYQHPLGIQQAFYGLEFSPDGSKLYYATLQEGIFQFDLNAGSPGAMISSRINVFPYSTSLTYCGGMQLAPNGKIYLAFLFDQHLLAINNPNAAGLACNVQTNAITMWFNTGLGLQNLPTDYGFPQGPQTHGPTHVCIGQDTVHYYMDQYSCSDSVAWEIKGATHTYISESEGILYLQFQAPGTDTLIATGYTACGFAKDTLVVTAVSFDQPNLGPDVQLCPGNSVTLSAGAGFTSYQWNTGATTSSISTSLTGPYWVTTMDNDCPATDTIHVISFPALPPVALGPDTSICMGGIFPLDAGAGYANYAWQDLSTGQTYTAWQPGTYYVTAADGCGGTSSDTITIVTDNSFQANLGNDTVLCPGSNILLNPGTTGSSYLWSTGSSAPQINITVPGSYWVEVINRFGCVARDTINVDLCVGIVEESLGGVLTIYPVPATDQIGFSIPQAFQGTATLRITDPIGRTVLQRNLYEQGKDAPVSLDIQSFSVGIYWLELENDGKRWIGKFVKQ